MNAEPSKKKHSMQVTDNQKQLLTEFVKKHKDLQSDNFSSKFTYKDAASKWQEVASIINSTPGATRDWKGWRKTWQDLKSRAKIKASTNKRYARGTGGGPPQEDPLTKTEEDIMEIIKEVCVEGHKETNESEVKFNFDSITNNDIDFISDENIQEIPVVISSSCNNVDTIKNIVEPIAPSTAGNDITKGVCTPRVPKNKQFHHTLQALNSFQQNLDTQSSIQKQYYEEKIKVLTRIAVAKEKAVEVKNRIAVTLEAIADSIS